MKHCKSSILPLLGISLLASSCNSATKSTAENAACDYFKLGTGVNLSHWLSQSHLRGKDREEQIRKKDFDAIAAMGFEHVRLPIDEEQFYDTDLNRYDDAFVLLKKAIDWTLENDMNIIVDLHITRSHNFNTEEKNTLFKDEAAQEQMVKIWKDLQSFLMSYPNDRVAYELLNEAVAPTHEELNKLEAKLIAAIREKEPNRFIIVGSNHQQSIYTMPYLNVPENDKHLILSFHYYNPFLVTHYGTAWTPLANFRGKISYPGKLLDETELYDDIDSLTRIKFHQWNGVWDINRIEEDIMIAVNKADSLGLQVYCGEFGAYPAYIDKAPRLAWYKDIMEVFRKHKVANAHWCYKGDFPIVNEDLSENELPAILLNR